MTPEKKSNDVGDRKKVRPFPWWCPTCGKEEVFAATVAYQAKIGHDGRMYEFEIPELKTAKCRSCGALLFSNSADDQIRLALRAHIGLLTPDEIRTKRETLGLSQKKLAELTGIAEATVSRWETGALIQSRAMDNFL